MTTKLVCNKCYSSNGPAAVYQNKKYRGKRVFNLMTKDKTKARCTVCNNEQSVK